jgi:hypothetical protein
MSAFGTFLKKQRHRDDPVGDLARDFLQDLSMCHIRPSTFLTSMKLRKRLTKMGACPDALEALDRANSEWTAFKMKQKLSIPLK